jgi:molybdenum cofactor guanylyltransferase
MGTDFATQITIAILAGGQGSRAGGVDKGLQEIVGRPLIAWSLETLAPQGSAILICANRNIATYGAFAKVLPDSGKKFRGPLAGIASALAACRTEYLLTAPVDCPIPPADVAARLFKALQSSGARATVAHDGEHRQPLFALYARELAGSAAIALAAGDAVWKWQDSAGAIEVDFSDSIQRFANLNTVEDFSAFSAAHA